MISLKLFTKNYLLLASIAMATLTDTAFANGMHREILQGDISPTTLCTSHTSQQAVAVATFESEAECNRYVGALVLGAPIGYAYSNCSSSSYCMTFGTPLAGSLEGFNLVALSATCIWDATLGFSTPEACESALNASSISCPPGGTSGCNGDILQIAGCNSGHSGSGGAFSILMSALPSFNFIPAGNCAD